MRASRERGASIAEFAVVLSLFVPLMLTIVYAVLQASNLYMIKANLDVACRKASRELAILYNTNQAQATAPAGSNTVFTNTRIPNFVVNNGQFDNPQFVTNLKPGTVTVTIHYPTQGGFGLPPFPNPDVLNLGGGFDLNSQQTFSLE
jgi:hypothetical protein